jgi:hypothetical protein
LFNRQAINSDFESITIDYSLLLTRQPTMSCSAAVCQPTARHQNAAVARLQQVLITQSVGWHTAACLLKINRLGASGLLLLGVVALAKGITLVGEARLDKGVA